MSYLNTVTLIGNLGKDPEVLKDTDKGKFVRIHLATTKKYRNTEKELISDTQWHTVYFNGKSAEFASTYLHKGDKLLAIGELRTNKWEDKEGVTHYSTSIFGKECKSLTGKLKATELAEAEAIYEEIA